MKNILFIAFILISISVSAQKEVKDTTKNYTEQRATKAGFVYDKDGEIIAEIQVGNYMYLPLDKTYTIETKQQLAAKNIRVFTPEEKEKKEAEILKKEAEQKEIEPKEEEPIKK